MREQNTRQNLHWSLHATTTMTMNNNNNKFKNPYTECKRTAHVSNCYCVSFTSRENVLNEWIGILFVGRLFSFLGASST